MRILYRTMMKQLLRDPVLRPGALLALLLGIFIALDSIIISGFKDVYVQNFYFYIGETFMAALLAFCIGREFSDGTVRNKIIAGYSKAQYYLASLLCAVTVAVFYFLLTAGPFALALIPEYHRLSAQASAEAFLCIFLSNLFSAVTATAVCNLTRNQIAGVLCTFAAIFGLYMLGEITEQADGGQSYSYEYLYDENDQPVFAPNGKPLIIKKEKWIYKEPQHSVLMVLHHGNPITTMGKLSCVFQDSENWTAAEQKKNRQELDSYALQDMHPRYPVTIPVIILIPLLGLISFRKKAIS